MLQKKTAQETRAVTNEKWKAWEQNGETFLSLKNVKLVTDEEISSSEATSNTKKNGELTRQK